MSDLRFDRAAEALHPRSPCAGNAYFISQGQPVSLWPRIGDLLRSVGVPVPTRSVSYKDAYRLGMAFEWLYTITLRTSEPPVTRFVAARLAKSHYFCIDAARRDFGYEPTVSTAEGMRRLLETLADGRDGAPESSRRSAAAPAAPV